MLGEKQELFLEKQRLQRELAIAQASCSTLQNRINHEMYDKLQIYWFIVCMYGVMMVSILYGTVLKK